MIVIEHLGIAVVAHEANGNHIVDHLGREDHDYLVGVPSTCHYFDEDGAARSEPIVLGFESDRPWIDDEAATDVCPSCDLTVTFGDVA